MLLELWGLWSNGIGWGGLRGLNVTFEQHADGHFNDGLGAGFLVTVDLVETDVVLAIAGVAEFCHCIRVLVEWF